MIVKIKKLYEDAVIPTYGTEKSACCDIRAYLRDDINKINRTDDGREYVEVPPHCTVTIGTGLAMEPPAGYCALIFARSGIAKKFGLAPANKVPIIDEDYRGEWFIPIHNHSNTMKRVYNNERIAQVMFVPYEQAAFDEVEELSETERGAGGFGSTGTM